MNKTGPKVETLNGVMRVARLLDQAADDLASEWTRRYQDDVLESWLFLRLKQQEDRRVPLQAAGVETQDLELARAYGRFCRMVLENIEPWLRAMDETPGFVVYQAEGEFWLIVHAEWRTALLRFENRHLGRVLHALQRANEVDPS